jgi:hypothetical protein
VDIVGFLNDITGNNLLFWKVVLATIVFLGAGFQIFLAARFWEVTGFPPMKAATAATVHRWNGRITLTLAVLVAISCVAGPAGPLSPTRVMLHSIFGTFVFVILVTKFTILRVLGKGKQFLPYIGTSLFLTFGFIWGTSVADFVGR